MPRFQGYLTSAALGFLLDHVVQGNSILPGAGMLEACTARSVFDLGTAILAMLCSGSLLPGVRQPITCR